MSSCIYINLHLEVSTSMIQPSTRSLTRYVEQKIFRGKRTDPMKCNTHERKEPTVFAICIFSLNTEKDRFLTFKIFRS